VEEGEKEGNVDGNEGDDVVEREVEGGRGNVSGERKGTG
jgi:hypothetical protein